MSVKVTYLPGYQPAPQPEPMGNSIRRILLGADTPTPQRPISSPLEMEPANPTPWWDKYTRMSSEELRRLPPGEQMKVRQAFQEQAKASSPRQAGTPL
jgi:hypothetical protein